MIQSNYLPWRGYFDFINNVDVFVFYDDVQYTKGDWRNRNKIKTPTGSRWLTVPIFHRKLSQKIYETEIDNSQKWQRTHRGLVHDNYINAPYLKHIEDILENTMSQESKTISELNARLISTICEYLDIKTVLRHSLEFAISGEKTERLIHLLKSVGATTYVSGPNAKAYLDENKFHDANIKLEYKSYRYASYPQQWGAFCGTVSIVDLIANCGPNSKMYIDSSAPNEVVTP